MKHTQEEMLKKRKQAWQSAGLSHPVIFTQVFRKKELCMLLLSILLPHIKIKDLRFVDYEKTIKEHPSARGVRLDIYTEDDDRVYNIEMQTINSDNIPKRVRYYQANIDSRNLEAGSQVDVETQKKNFDKLKDTIIIFICTFDSFGKNLPYYTIEYRCKEDNSILYNDGTQKIFFNTTAYDKETNKNLHDVLALINGKDITDNELIDKFKTAVEEIKYDDSVKGDFMTYTFDMEDAYTLGEREGELNKQIEIARNFLDVADDVTIAKKTGLPLEKVQELRREALSMV